MPPPNRTQCNISISTLAAALGVSRQMVSAWENEKKAISAKRAGQLADYFGIEPQYFGHIDDRQRKEILSKAMYRWEMGEDEYYLYRPSAKEENAPTQTISFAIKERRTLLSDEYRDKRSCQKEIVNQINDQIGGPIQRSLEDQMSFINRGIAYYGRCLDNFDAAFSQSPAKKMIYYIRLQEAMKAISLALDIDCDLGPEKDNYMYAEDPVFIREMSQRIKDHMAPMLAQIDQFETQRPTKKNEGNTLENAGTSDNLTLEEASKMIQEQVENGQIPEGAEVVRMEIK